MSKLWLAFVQYRLDNKMIVFSSPCFDKKKLSVSVVVKKKNHRKSIMDTVSSVMVTCPACVNRGGSLL